MVGKVPQGQRKRIYERDGYTCQGPCERKLPAHELTLDHIIPRSKGGKNSDDNLQTMCKPCNIAKADSMPEGVWRC